MAANMAGIGAWEVWHGSHRPGRTLVPFHSVSGGYDHHDGSTALGAGGGCRVGACPGAQVLAAKFRGLHPPAGPRCPLCRTPLKRCARLAPGPSIRPFRLPEARVSEPFILVRFQVRTPRRQGRLLPATSVVKMEQSSSRYGTLWHCGRDFVRGRALRTVGGDCGSYIVVRHACHHVFVRVVESRN